MAKRSASSGTWLREHFSDEYVKRAQKEGYRSRACYKLLELQEKDRLIKPGMCVVDLGAAPGSWSQVAAQLVGAKGRVVASDILLMDSLADVEFIHGDFTEDAVFEELLAVLGGQKADLVISDMAPNMSGVKDVDQPRSMYLCELALDMAKQVLRPGGDFVTKIFHGEDFDKYFKELRPQFDKVVTRKPSASRPRSREVYLVARGLRA
ncbi:MAG: 23S rRNA (uridine(2552)-2'-O)-methyltransferase RlmE [Spongiibacteraceae bacterium]